MKEEKESIINRNEMSQLQVMSKEELIQTCLEIKDALTNANHRLETYKDLMAQLYEESERVKTKHPDINQTEYNQKWSWVNKTVFVLKKIDRPLLSSEIISFIIPYEPVLKYSRHKAQAFSAHLGKAVKYNRVIAHKLGGCRGFYYILPNWKDKEGNILKEYEDKIFFK